jgi:3-isopropylmalate dehydrogenase
MTWSVGFVPVNDHGRVLGKSALRVLAGLGYPVAVTEFDLGPRRYLATGDLITEDEFEQLSRVDALFVGAPPVGGAEAPRGLLERGIIFKIRSGLDLFVNLRRFTGEGPVDIAVVRENTEGAYIGEGGVLRPGTPYAIATQGSITTAFGVERCVRYAFALARARQKRITLVHKIRVLEYAGSIWHETFERLSRQHHDVECDYVDVDTACVQLVQDPARFDVIVTDNLFGDIVSDVAGAVTGALSRSGSADLNPQTITPSLFEPLHAAAASLRHSPVDHVDPRGAYAAVALLLDHFGEHDPASRLARAVYGVGADESRTTAQTEAIVLEMCERAADRLAVQLRLAVLSDLMSRTPSSAIVVAISDSSTVSTSSTPARPAAASP